MKNFNRGDWKLSFVFLGPHSNVKSIFWWHPIDVLCRLVGLGSVSWGRGSLRIKWCVLDKSGVLFVDVLTCCFLSDLVCVNHWGWQLRTCFWLLTHLCFSAIILTIIILKHWFIQFIIYCVALKLTRLTNSASLNQSSSQKAGQPSIW